MSGRVSTQLCRGRRCRSVAGVHYESDNIAGLEVGQKVIEQWLPGFLEQYAGADPDKVREKIEKIRYDWSEHALLADAPAPQTQA